MNLNAIWTLLFSPLVACGLITAFALKKPRLASTIALIGILLSLIASLFVFVFYLKNPAFLPVDVGYTWINAPGLMIQFGYLLDPLSILMLLVVTGVSSLIFLYSTEYMKGDDSYSRYFAYLSLFAFSMLGIVLANNFIMLFVFWELVAVSSYLLIGFWYQKPSAADAGNKAFIVNRIADLGFIVGIVSVWLLSGLAGAGRTFSFTELSHTIPAGLAAGLFSPATLAIAALFVFCGVVGKSAQFPLYIWLPDAMEGPTPVSALIHAATMVAAGVYMLSRSFFLVSGIDEALHVIAWIGAITALMAALLAVIQNDIKKILAYSTISQLGYMVMALGLGSSVASMYHLTTHAFFKALLFLGAGAMIHSLHTQDIWEMGALLKRMPVTAITFLIGTAALCGIFPLSGFFSKDEILHLAHEESLALYILGLFTAFLTAFYMTRAVWVAILGPERANKHAHGHHGVHDASIRMKIPLIILAVLAIIGGFIGIPQFLMGEHAHHEPLDMGVAILSTIAALSGIALGTLIYKKARGKSDPLTPKLGILHTLLDHKYYLDNAFQAMANFFQKLVSPILYWFDSRVVIQTGVNGVAAVTRGFAFVSRLLQTGRVHNYALSFAVGILILVTWFIGKG